MHGEKTRARERRIRATAWQRHLVRANPGEWQTGAEELRFGPKGTFGCGRMGRESADDQAHRRRRFADDGQAAGPHYRRSRRLCDEFVHYVKAHPEEYRDQTNPPKRIAEINQVFGDRAAATLKPSEIEDWLDEIQRQRSLENATVNKMRGTFSMLFKHGKRKDLVSTNPAAEVPLRDTGHGIVERFLSAEEEMRLRKVLQRKIDSHDSIKHPELRKQAIHRLLEFEVSVKSGMRRSEQYNLRWGDVDFERRIMRLRKTKNGKPRNAFIIDDVAKALRQLRDLDLERRDRSGNQPNKSPHDVVFAKVDNKKWWQAALDEAKIKNYRWHDNRHTFCSRLVQAGVHLKVVQEAAGHASIASTMRYAHFAPSQVVDAMAVLNSKR